MKLKDLNVGDVFLHYTGIEFQLVETRGDKFICKNISTGESVELNPSDEVNKLEMIAG